MNSVRRILAVLVVSGGALAALASTTSTQVADTTTTTSSSNTLLGLPALWSPFTSTATATTSTTTTTATAPSAVATATTTTTTTTSNSSLKYGVNIDLAKAAPGSDDTATFATMKQYGQKIARISIPLAADTDSYMTARFRKLIDLAAANDIKLLPVLLLPFTWGDRTDNGKYPAGNSAALYRQGYDRTRAFVAQFRNDVPDWELQNEVNLLRTDANGVPLYGKGWARGEFDTTIMRDWGQVLHGMSDAIGDINSTYGVSLRRVLGISTTNFGFLEYMVQIQSVKVEVVDYHYYEHVNIDPTNYWGGAKPDFDLFKKLGGYGRPVIIGELNAGEVYDSDYTNVDGNAKTETGYKSLATILADLKKQKSAKIESVIAYTLVDQPSKRAPENRFGLMRDFNTPKVSMLLLGAQAGAPLSSQQQNSLTSRQISY
ncbi:hypothetical protein BH09PSE3_BH09PSE3_18460 [soil metagenome]